MFIPLPPRLNPEVKRALQNGELTTDEVLEVQKETDTRTKIMQKGFRRVLVITVSIFILMVALTIPQYGNPAALFSILISGVLLTVIVVIFKWLYVDAVKRQFLHAVKKGYPNFFEQS